MVSSAGKAPERPIFKILSAEELHDLLKVSVTRGDQIPSLEICQEFQYLAPHSPLARIMPRIKDDPPARRHAIALRNSLGPLETSWHDVLKSLPLSKLDNPEFFEDERKKVFERITALKQAIENALPLMGTLQADWRNVFESLPSLEEIVALHKGRGDVSNRITALKNAIEAALPFMGPFYLGPREEHSNEAALKLKEFFDAVVTKDGRGKPYGFSANGPTVRFVRTGLEKLGWPAISNQGLVQTFRRSRNQ